MLTHKLTVTGKDPVPVQIFNGNVHSRKNLKTTQEDADTIIIHHLVASAPVKAIVIVDDIVGCHV